MKGPALSRLIFLPLLGVALGGPLPLGVLVRVGEPRPKGREWMHAAAFLADGS